MADLIPRDAAVRALVSSNGDYLDAWGRIEKIPSVDAVPVVRCKDCGYFQANNAEEGDWSGRCTNVYLPMNGTTVDGWWFCADGWRG